MKLLQLKPHCLEPTKLEVHLVGQHRCKMLTSGKFQEEMTGTSTKSKLELKMEPMKKPVQALEKTKEEATHGKFQMENTSPRLNTDKEVGWMESPSSPARELDHLNSEEMVEMDHSPTLYRWAQS